MSLWIDVSAKSINVNVFYRDSSKWPISNVIKEWCGSYHKHSSTNKPVTKWKSLLPIDHWAHQPKPTSCYTLSVCGFTEALFLGSKSSSKSNSRVISLSWNLKQHSPKFSNNRVIWTTINIHFEVSILWLNELWITIATWKQMWSVKSPLKVKLCNSVWNAKTKRLPSSVRFSDTPNIFHLSLSLRPL